MKRMIALAILGCYSLTMLALPLVVTKDGFRDEQDSTKSFVVVDIPDVDAATLYARMIEYINVNYKNPDEVLKGNVENKYVKFATFKPDFVEVSNVGKMLPTKVNYTTSLNFKDGKVKYEIVAFDCKLQNGDYAVNLIKKGFFGYGLFSKTGEIKQKEMVPAINAYFAAEIDKISSYLKTGGANEDGEDW